MARPLRIAPAGVPYFVTSRCEGERYWLLPDHPDIEKAIGSALVEATRRHEARLLAATAMSNHPHLTVHLEKENLSAFMQFFLGKLARAVNAIRKRRGRVFGGRFSSQQVLDDPSVLDRIAYTLDNPVKAGIAANALEWPGFSTAQESLLGVKRSFPRMTFELGDDGFERIVWHEDDMIPLEVVPPPSVGQACAAREVWRRSLRDELDARAKSHLAERLKAGLPRPSPACVKRMKPSHRPRRPKRGPQPLCFAATKETRDEYRRVRRATCVAYYEASARLRAGEAPEFPEGTHPPSVPRAATAALRALLAA